MHVVEGRVHRVSHAPMDGPQAPTFWRSLRTPIDFDVQRHISQSDQTRRGEILESGLQEVKNFVTNADASSVCGITNLLVHKPTFFAARIDILAKLI